MPDKDEILALNAEHVCPNRVAVWQASGIDLVIGRREGYKIWDIDGREFWDLHLNGGAFSFGHRTSELVEILRTSLDTLDIGNHHFPSVARAQLAKALSESTDGALPYAVFAASGSEAADVAIKTARKATGRRAIVGLKEGYHGRTGLAGAVGDDETARYFLSDDPEHNLKAPFGDLGAIAAVFHEHDAAAVLVEMSPATAGFPIPSRDYLKGIEKLCRTHGALFIADEVQTGLARSGRTWAYQTFGVTPDILITGKGLSGGLYPMAAALLSHQAGGWLRERGWAHVSTFGGAELGCPLATRVTQIASEPGTLVHVARLSEYLSVELSDVANRRPFLSEIRQLGLIIGLKFDDPAGGAKMMRALYRRGVWAIFAGFDRSVLQFKPGVFLGLNDAADILNRLDDAIADVVRG